MKPLTHEWIEKAEADFATAQRELRARTRPNFDAACFHAQQCAEKYLKARLQEADIRFGKTHDLTSLLDQLLPCEPGLASLREDLRALNAFAVAFRYPGTAASKELAKEALSRCRKVRKVIRTCLTLDD